METLSVPSIHNPASQILYLTRFTLLVFSSHLIDLIIFCHFILLSRSDSLVFHSKTLIVSWDDDDGVPVTYRQIILPVRYPPPLQRKVVTYFPSVRQQFYSRLVLGYLSQEPLPLRLWSRVICPTSKTVTALLFSLTTTTAGVLSGTLENISFISAPVWSLQLWQQEGGILHI